MRRYQISLDGVPFERRLLLAKVLQQSGEKVWQYSTFYDVHRKYCGYLVFQGYDWRTSPHTEGLIDVSIEDFLAKFGEQPSVDFSELERSLYEYPQTNP